jgi:hypothetical protein
VGGDEHSLEESDWGIQDWLGAKRAGETEESVEEEENWSEQESLEQEGEQMTREDGGVGQTERGDGQHRHTRYRPTKGDAVDLRKVHLRTKVQRRLFPEVLGSTVLVKVGEVGVLNQLQVAHTFFPFAGTVQDAATGLKSSDEGVVHTGLNKEDDLIFQLGTKNTNIEENMGEEKGRKTENDQIKVAQGKSNSVWSPKHKCNGGLEAFTLLGNGQFSVEEKVGGGSPSEKGRAHRGITFKTRSRIHNCYIKIMNGMDLSNEELIVKFAAMGGRSRGVDFDGYHSPPGS